MRAEGVKKLDPRQRLLNDLARLIAAYRAEEYRPILLMDANGDYQSDAAPDNELARFLIDACLPIYMVPNIRRSRLLYDVLDIWALTRERTRTIACLNTGEGFSSR